VSRHSPLKRRGAIEITALASKLVERLAKGRPEASRQGDRRQAGEDASHHAHQHLSAGLPQNAVSRRSLLPNGAATSAPTVYGHARIILRARRSPPAPPPTAEARPSSSKRALRAAARIFCV